MIRMCLLICAGVMDYFPAQYPNLWDTLFVAPDLNTPASAIVKEMRLGPKRTRHKNNNAAVAKAARNGKVLAAKQPLDGPAIFKTDGVQVGAFP